jgi:hypothetical protein
MNVHCCSSERRAQILNTPQADDPSGIILLAKAPDMSTDKDGFKLPRNWDGKLVKTSKGYGYSDNKGEVWVPTGLGGVFQEQLDRHMVPHWDVQNTKNPYNYCKKEKLYEINYLQDSDVYPQDRYEVSAYLSYLFKEEELSQMRQNLIASPFVC